MVKIVLFEPEIPPNTGNIMRLAVNTGAELHLIKPLGFELDDKRLRRAGLDYRDWASVASHENWDAFVASAQPTRLFAISTRGQQGFHDVAYQEGDALVFGPETRGLPQAFLDALPANQVLRIPMLPNSRSMNLSNAVSVVVYEAWRQLGFPGAQVQAEPKS